jgi:hypothetical protein
MKGIPTEEFEGFGVEVVDVYTLECTHMIRGLHVTLGNYTLTDDLYVVDLADTNIVLGIEWLYSLGDIKMYQIMRMEFRDKQGRRVFLRGMSTDLLRIMATKRMEVALRHRNIAWVAECVITPQKEREGCQHYHMDIHNLMGKHDKVFGKIPPGVPPDRGFEHTIELEEGAKPVIMTPYGHLKRFKEEIEKTILFLRP